MASLHKLKKNSHWIDFLLYFFCGFPFLYILPLPSDTQPYAVLVAIIYMFLINRVVLPRFFRLSIIAFCAVFITFFGTILLVPDVGIMMLFRKVYNYISLLIIPIAVYNSMLRTDGLVERWVKGIIVIWLVVGLVQTAAVPSFLGRFVANFRTSATRGVPSLASEPSFYGYMMVFFAVIASRFKNRKESIFYIFICSFQVVFLAESSVATLYLLIFVVMVALRWLVFSYKKSPSKFVKSVLIAVFAGLMSFYAVREFFENNASSRLVQVFIKVINNFDSLKTLDDIYKLDASIGQRVNAIVTSIKGTITNWGLPHGFIYSDFTGRIMSGYGVVMYEFGFIGIYLLLLLTYFLFKGFDQSVPIIVGITAMMFSAIQMASPLFAFLLGYALFRESRLRSLRNSAELHYMKT